MIIKESGGTAARDPFITYLNGSFYHSYTYQDEIYVAKAESVAGLKEAKGVKVYSPEPDMPYSKMLWAPELHMIGGKCYIYVACCDGNNLNHRMYVLYNDSSDPQMPYRNHGKIFDSVDEWAIDTTILHWKGNMYSVWSGWDGKPNSSQNIFIAQMSDPFTICSERVMLSTPEHEWEKIGAGGPRMRATINEGPCVLQKGEKLYILYSAAGSWCDDYCLGMLELVGEDVMDPAAWKKHPQPVFAKTETVKGPGHCSVVTDTPEGDWLFYHAFDESCKGGWNSAHASAQKFTWDGDFPVFGEPES